MFNKERFEARYFKAYDMLIDMEQVINGAVKRASDGRATKPDIALLALHSLVMNYERKENEWSIIEPIFDKLCGEVIPGAVPPPEQPAKQPEQPTNPPADVVKIYTDGACSGNPGPGGYGCKLMLGERFKEISGGFKRTTNNRMEIMAVIKGLQMLKEAGTRVVVYSDSKYVTDAFNQGWLAKWMANEWMKKEGNKTVKVANQDLWKALLAEVAKHTVSFIYVKGHSTNPHNARCDVLAVAARQQSNLPDDVGYLAANGANV